MVERSWLKPIYWPAMVSCGPPSLASMIALLLREKTRISTVTSRSCSRTGRRKSTPDSKQTASSFDFSKLTENEFKTLDEDPAGLGGRREQYEVVYVFQKGNQLVLPIRGRGLWSTLWGFLSIDANDFTTRGITFYSHAETPGLGGEVDSDAFKSQWMEENATLDANGKVIIEVAKAGQAAEGEIDGLAGATITTQGVDKLIKYWLGPDGFGPFLVGNGSKFGEVAQN